jgi:hypothetical protein
MAEANNNNPNKTAPAAVSKEPKSRSIFIYLLPVTVFIVAGLIFWVYRSNNSGIVFTVNGQKYTQKDVSNIVAYPLKFHRSSRNSLSWQAYNYLRREQAARNLNIEPSSDQINQAEITEFGKNTKNNINNTPWIKLVSYDTALKQNLSTNNLGTYQGYSFIFWFGQHLEKGPAYTAPDFGNKALIKSDKSYASNRANYYYNKLKSTSMSPNDVLSAVQHDDKLSFALPNNKFLSQSVQFGVNSNETWRQTVFYPDIMNYISSQNRPGLSSIHTGKISITSKSKTANDYADGYYYIVQLNEAKQVGISNSSDFTNAVNKVEAQYKGW